MNPSRLFVLRPVATSLLMTGIMLPLNSAEFVTLATSANSVAVAPGQSVVTLTPVFLTS